MAVGTLISVEEYLKTSYRPDCDYVDGEVQERGLGERRHSQLQRKIILYLVAHYPGLRPRLFPEQRVQVKATRFRVPDICVLSGQAPNDEIVTVAPELCIEILSPEDTMTRTMKRIEEYSEMGVPVCWIIDPVNHACWIAAPGRLEEPSDGILRACGIEMPLAEVL